MAIIVTGGGAFALESFGINMRNGTHLRRRNEQWRHQF